MLDLSRSVPVSVPYSLEFVKLRARIFAPPWPWSCFSGRPKSMNRAIAIGIASGLLQFGLACYAFRFAHHLGKFRVGWTLFITLSLLALCTPLLSAKLHFEHVVSAPGVNILYTS